MSQNALNPYEYIRDDARRRIRVTARETLGADDLMTIVNRQASEQTWTYGMLYDLRATVGATLTADALAVAACVQAHMKMLGPRGSVALVTKTSQVVGAGQAYAWQGAKSGLHIDVFWDLEEAEEWLDRLA